MCDTQFSDGAYPHAGAPVLSKAEHNPGGRHGKLSMTWLVRSVRVWLPHQAIRRSVVWPLPPGKWRRRRL